jgi:hypothetical protein
MPPAAFSVSGFALRIRALADGMATKKESKKRTAYWKGAAHKMLPSAYRRSQKLAFFFDSFFVAIPSLLRLAAQCNAADPMARRSESFERAGSRSAPSIRPWNFPFKPRVATNPRNKTVA